MDAVSNMLPYNFIGDVFEKKSDTNQDEMVPITCIKPGL